ncbi:MAG: CpsD/CapB family tyrosine-protein kinase [Finegoldia sp.]|nr:CpsD/CapB family tyrosine-protein kinase [Finegoldia sp.]
MSKKEDKMKKLNEQYRFLRTNIKFNDQSVKSIVVTSGYFGEGKTTVAANLAKSLALGGDKVVIVDLDLRRPSLRKYFDMDMEIGATNVIENELDYRNAISHDESIWDLDIIHSGAIPVNRISEIISSQKMEKFINDLEKDYDYIIIDTPPVQEYSDAITLAAMADGVAVVYKVGETKVGELKETLDKLKNVKANILGLVKMNNE